MNRKSRCKHVRRQRGVRDDDTKVCHFALKSLGDNILIRKFPQQPLNGQLMARNIDATTVASYRCTRGYRKVLIKRFVF